MRNGATTWRDHDRARNVSKSRISQASEADLSGPLPMSALGLGRVKTQRRANCREKYSFGSLLQEREEHIELRRRCM
jgi:hypothetical protein